MSANTIDRAPEFTRRDAHRAKSSRATLVLLACGILYSVAYVVANDVVAATQYQGYSRMSQAISELSATGAPTRSFLMAMLPVFAALLIAFGVGVLRAAHGKRALRVTADLLIAFGAIGVTWFWFPMTSRADMVAGTVPSNDFGHIVLTIVTVVLILATIGFGAAAFGMWFRVYSAVTVAAVLLFGALTGMEATKVATGGPTPYMGLFERINVWGWMLWLAVLAVALLRVETGRARTPGSLPRKAKARGFLTGAFGTRGAGVIRSELDPE